MGTTDKGAMTGVRLYDAETTYNNDSARADTDLCFVEITSAQEAALNSGITAETVAKLVTTDDKGTAGGVAELDSSGKVPSSQLPSYVDDVLEYANRASFPSTGEAGKIYIAKDTNLTYRWSGSAYVVISSSLALGETSSTAYRGDRGAAAYAHISETNNPHSVTKAQVGLGNVDNTSDANKPISTATQAALDQKQKQVTSGSSDPSGGSDGDVYIKTDTELATMAALAEEASARIAADALKQDAETGKGLSTNDYTTAEKTKLAGIAAGAQVNIIQEIKVNGTAQTITNKAVDIEVPTALEDLTDDSTHRTVTDAEKTTWSGKQDELVSGTNIKTINGAAITGSGNITVQKTITYGTADPSGGSDGDIYIKYTA